MFKTLFPVRKLYDKANVLGKKNDECKQHKLIVALSLIENVCMHRTLSR